MKTLLKCAMITILCFSMTFAFTSCADKGNGDGTNISTPTANNTDNTDNTNTENNNTPENATPTPDNSKNQATPAPNIPDSTIKGTIWLVTELSFNTTKKYYAAKGDQAKVVFDGVFTHKETGETLTIPGFWYESTTFKLRFAPTKTGIWEYKTVCATDDSLNGKTGVIYASAYTGDLEIYKRGFVKAQLGTKHFMYADGTPFFYLGDTHWTLLDEEYDSAGPLAGNLKTDSHFKYIVDKRVSQGYTVYQSEPFPGDLTDGVIQRQDAEAFNVADKYFQYIAEKGLVHAHAQVCFPTFAWNLVDNDKALEVLARYWVARYGAYPVMWTLSQEIDNDFYFERGDQQFMTYENNLWVKLAEYIHKYDAYNHPLTGHQEGASFTTVTGESTTDSRADNNGASVFLSKEVTERTGHSWWGAQWSISFLDVPRMHRIAKEYWSSNKIGVMYEGRYCNLWTKDYGARAQGWFAYLSGSFGYGYGAQDIWAYKSDYSTAGNSFDGRDTVTVADKSINWPEAVELESGYQVGYMRQFFEKLEWWKLVPDFDTQNYFESYLGSHYVCATIGNEVYVAYLFNTNTASGKLEKMDNSATYTIKWFNPRTNEYTLVSSNEKPSASGYVIPEKPDTNDWVLIATKN
ncbi:MAG: DUF4038 domain-containing protein [Clostridia bacterium]|nr:DUF4038 domain-containing protein [Clostridia bacterium]